MLFWLLGRDSQPEQPDLTVPVGLQGHGDIPGLQEELGEEGRLPRESRGSQAVPAEPPPMATAPKPTHPETQPRCAASSCAPPAPCPRKGPVHLPR